MVFGKSITSNAFYTTVYGTADYPDTISDINTTYNGNILTDSRKYGPKGYIAYCSAVNYYGNDINVSVEPLSIKSVIDCNNRFYGGDNIDSIRMISRNCKRISEYALY
jgi:hypothetical protein